MSSLSPRHLQARALARAGWKVFPCRVNGREPAVPNGYFDATDDLQQIDRWWATADYNIGTCPDDQGLCVVDLDMKKGKDGVSTWLGAGGHLDETYEVETPTGGLHLYFAGQIANTVERIGPGVDTRGVGGYVLVPPSVIDGVEYKVVNDAEPVDLPAWVAQACERRDLAQAGQPDIEFDLPHNVEHAVLYLRAAKPAVEGCRDVRTFEVMCHLRDLAISPERAIELATEHWLPRCDPSTEQFFVPKAESAYLAGNAQNAAPGARAAPPAAEAFAHLLDREATPATKAEGRPEQRAKFYFKDVFEQRVGARLEWQIPEFIPVTGTWMMFGPTGFFKSYMCHDVALSIATGHPSLFGPVNSPGATFYGAGEGRLQISQGRAVAWELAHDVLGKSYPNYVERAPLLALDELQEWGDAIKRRVDGHGVAPKLIVVDTYAKAITGWDEQEARVASKFIHFCDTLVEEFKCSVGFVHHTGKDVSKGARGSSALPAGVDSAFEVVADKDTRAVAVWCRKQRDAEERSAPWTFQGRQFGGNLVFFPTTAEEHHELTHAEDPLDRKHVAAVLIGIGALDQTTGVSTAALAVSLAPLRPQVTAEDHLREVETTKRKLVALSRGPLEVLCEHQGKHLVWFASSTGKSSIL